MSVRILLVDDDLNALRAYQRSLRPRFGLVDTSEGGTEALERLSQSDPYAVVVADMRMPRMNGIQFLSRVRDVSPHTVRMMLTGSHDLETAVSAVHEGAVFRFLTKPCSPEALAQEIEAGLEQHRLVMAEVELLEKTLIGSVKLLVDILSMVDPDSFGRTTALRQMVTTLGVALQLPQTWEVEIAGLLAGIGAVTLPPQVAARHRAGEVLTPDEAALVTRVPELGATLLKNIPRLERVARIVLYQHKPFQGGGFPEDGVVGVAIPLGARILKLASDLLHLQEQGLSCGQALARLQSDRANYDPHVLSAALACFGVPEMEPSHSAPRGVLLDDLQVGHILCADIQTGEGRRLLKAGSVITETLLQSVRNFARLWGLREPMFVQGTPPRGGRSIPRQG